MKKSLASTEAAACYGCAKSNPLYILPGVRLIKCSCGTIQPASTKRLVAAFYNPDKQPITL